MMDISPAERRFLISLRDGADFEMGPVGKEARRRCHEAGLATYRSKIWKITEAGLDALKAKPVKHEHKEPLSSWAVGR